MDNVVLCICGCGAQAVYAATHCNTRPRARFTADDYDEIDLGFKTPCYILKTRVRARKQGYAGVRIGGRYVRAHRAMYEQEVGPIPGGFVIDHLCRNPRCFRPDHLEAVTPGENKRRGKNTKLDWIKVDEIRATTGVVSAPKLAAKFGVSEFLIYQVRRGKIWREDDRHPHKLRSTSTPT